MTAAADTLVASSTVDVARNVAILLGVVFWLATVYWVFKDARRRIEDPWLVGMATVLGAIPPFLGPLISFVIWIWMIVVGVVAVRQVLDYSNTGRAVIVCLIAGVACWIVTTLILVPLLVSSFIIRGLTG